MAQRRTTYGKTSGRTAGRTTGTTSRITPYIYDNTARDLQIRRQMETPLHQLSRETRKNREKARHMSIGYVAFLMGALLACAVFLVNYIQMQSELTAKITEVSRMESELNSLKLSNDEEYSRITSNINLEEIKRIAIGELGMTYAAEGQVIPYESISNDYMRQADKSQN